MEVLSSGSVPLQASILCVECHKSDSQAQKKYFFLPQKGLLQSICTLLKLLTVLVPPT